MSPLSIFAQDQSTFGKILRRLEQSPFKYGKEYVTEPTMDSGLHRIVGSGSTIEKELWEPQNDVS